MWINLFFTIGLMAVLLVFMASGVLLGRKGLKGSCKSAGDKTGCETCGNGEQECVKKENPLTAPLRKFLG